MYKCFNPTILNYCRPKHDWRMWLMCDSLPTPWRNSRFGAPNAKGHRSKDINTVLKLDKLGCTRASVSVGAKVLALEGSRKHRWDRTEPKPGVIQTVKHLHWLMIYRLGCKDVSSQLPYLVTQCFLCLKKKPIPFPMVHCHELPVSRGAPCCPIGHHTAARLRHCMENMQRHRPRRPRQRQEQGLTDSRWEEGWTQRPFDNLKL